MTSTISASMVAAAAEAMTWLGTPFSPHACAKGAGCDCVQLALACFKVAGVVPAEDQFPPYRLDVAMHQRESPVLDWLGSHPYFEVTGRAQPGCLYCFTVGRTVHHVGVGVGLTAFVHCWRNHGVTQASILDSTWSSRLHSIWRPTV